MVSAREISWLISSTERSRTFIKCLMIDLRISLNVEFILHHFTWFYNREMAGSEKNKIVVGGATQEEKNVV